MRVPSTVPDTRLYSTADGDSIYVETKGHHDEDRMGCTVNRSCLCQL